MVRRDRRPTAQDQQITVQLRAHGIRQQLGASLSGQPTRVHLLSIGSSWISYFNELGPVEVECGDHRWSVSMGESLVPCQVLIMLAHGTDLSREIWQIRAAAPELTVGVCCGTITSRILPT